jgi:large subunit ribosomal protein L13
MPAAPTHLRPTFQAKKNEAHGWHIADLSGKTLGRAATKIASVLRGKHTAKFTPHEDAGDFVIVINADKVKLTGKKWDDKKYFDHSLFPGGVRENSAKQLLARHPTSLVERAVWGMLPKGPLGRRLYKKLKVYAGDKHPHLAQQPKTLEIK